jgi:hypothetical protein
MRGAIARDLLGELRDLVEQVGRHVDEAALVFGQPPRPFAHDLIAKMPDERLQVGIVGDFLGESLVHSVSLCTPRAVAKGIV